jgi:peptidase C13-like protein
MEIQDQQTNPADIPAAASGAPREAGLPANGAAAACAGRADLLRNLGQNVRGGMGLALFRRLTPAAFRTAPADLALLVCADLLINLANSFILVGSGGTFAATSLTSFLFHLPLMLLCGLLAGRLLARPGLLTAIPVALIALSVPLELGHALLEGISSLRRLDWLAGYLDAPHYYRFFGWWTAAATLFCVRLAPGRPRQRLALVLLLLVVLVIPLWFVPRGDLWLSSAASGESGELHLTEQVLSAQRLLLDRELAGLLPGKKGEANLYFLGFAGDASQDVFLKELSAAAQLFAERFGTAGRTITLVNNPQTATVRPFATATNLDRALGAIGRKMNRDEDMLFLFLTSHGSADHFLAVDNGPLELDELSPEMVRQMLARSGITWKTIVVSACYAGGFIEPLKDDHTLIVTAADAAHESFGCTTGEDFTWFGRAYFGEALRRSYSFTAAFEQARQTIRKWEQEEGESPSEPQIWVGEAMKKKLAQLENRLVSRRGKGAGATPASESR